MIRVLVVDDDRGLVNVIARALAQPGWEIVPALSLADARNAGGSWDAIVADVKLPNGDGRDLRQEYAGVPFLLISGAPVDEPDEVRQGTIPFLPKPFTVAQLRDAVANLLPGARE
jgi:DNA-binding response OmpR family regulator